MRQSAAGQCPMSTGTSSGRRSLKQAGPSLQFGFYSSSCPSLDNIVSDKITWYTNEDGSTPAKLLRLFFHDCVAGGCEASILLNSNGAGPAERDAPISATLEKFNVIDDIKATVEAQCPGIVSCADILALAAVHSVRLVNILMGLGFARKVLCKILNKQFCLFGFSFQHSWLSDLI